MIFVRDVLQVKFGEMDKVLSGMRAAAENSPETSSHRRVLTDLSGNYFTLVVETKAESMDAYWAAMQANFQDPEQAEQTGHFAQYIESGYREFFTIEFESEGF